MVSDENIDTIRTFNIFCCLCSPKEISNRKFKFVVNFFYTKINIQKQIKQKQLVKMEYIMALNDIYLNETIIRKNKDATSLLHKDIIDWLCEIEPTHFISIQFPTRQRSKSLELAVDRLKTTMKYFEKQLNIRHWYKKHLFFICFAESNTNNKWHFHIFLVNDRYTDEEIMTAMDNTTKHFAFSKTVIDIRPIERTKRKVFSYVTKYLNANKLGHFDSNRIILSTDLFGI